MVDLADVGRLLVVSPHLDDAVLSLGATLAHMAAGGTDVTVLTVFAGDPESELEAASWDRHSGFLTAGEAVRARREEDRRACMVLDVKPVWLPYADGQYREASAEEPILSELRPLLSHANLVLIPGYPLINADHAWLHTALIERMPDVNFAMYVEQPYASDLAISRRLPLRPVIGSARLAAQTRLGSRADRLLVGTGGQAAARVIRWNSVRVSRRARAQKSTAVACYASQIRALGSQVGRCISLYDWIVGGEQVGHFGGVTSVS